MVNGIEPRNDCDEVAQAIKCVEGNRAVCENGECTEPPPGSKALSCGLECFCGNSERSQTVSHGCEYGEQAEEARTPNADWEVGCFHRTDEPGQCRTRKGKHGQVLRFRETSTVHRNGETVATKLDRIAQRARTDREAKFTSLIHLLNEEMLRECFGKLSGKAAPGIDKVTKAEYAKELEGNVADLIGRMKTWSYRPQAVRRKNIPKGNGQTRPLGIPALEDKLVQTGLATILEAIYEEDFLYFSYGFRPGRGCHDALREVGRIVHRQRVGYVVDADIKGFFDHVDHEWLMKFIGHRVSDAAIDRLIRRFLKAGVVHEAERWEPTEQGVPQGGAISPILANIYLHYSLDLWFERCVKPQCRGEAHMVRYADDFVACFQYEDEANRFYRALVRRLARFGLEVAAEKTRIIEFGRYAARDRARRGLSKPETFDFLGFTHYCGTDRNGYFKMKRKTSKKGLRKKVEAMKAWLDEQRHETVQAIWPTVNAKLRGHYAYYGVTDNTEGIRRYARAVTGLLYRWCNRRSQRRSYTWTTFQQMLRHYPLAAPRLRVNLYHTTASRGPVRGAGCVNGARPVL